MPPAPTSRPPHPGILSSALAAILVIAASASAQVVTAPIDSGRMVRLTTATGRITGRLLTPFRATDSLLRFCRYPGSPCEGVADSAAVRTITVASLRRVELSPGTQWRRGALIGGLIGGTVGGLATAALASMRDCWPKCSPRTPIIVAGALSGGLFWGGLGALWGSAFPRWDEGR